MSAASSSSAPSAPIAIVTVARYADFREAARALVARGARPESVVFREATAAQEVLPLALGPSQGADAQRPTALAEVRVPRRYVEIAETVAHHRDPARWALLYRVLYRLVHEDAHLLDLAADPDVQRLLVLRRQVRKDAERMKAFVRFRRIGAGEDERYIAFHRPDHRPAALVAPFFADRFAAMRWSILTPDESLHWDGEAVRFGPGVPRAEAAPPPGDEELESLWRAYYGAVFDPARVRLRKMRADMPSRFHATMPELTAVPELVREAGSRTRAMLEGQLEPTPTGASFLPEARSLVALREAARGCQGCDLYQCATQTVFGRGPEDARVMLVGEQPGDEEDLSGEPFVGPAGQLLDETLAEVGIARSQLYVTNAVKHFKFEMRGKRRIHKRPSPGEIRSCSPWLRAEVEAVAPRMILCLGASAAHSFFGPGFRLTDRRGEVLETPWAPWWMATYHPSALLRMPDEAARSEARRAFTADLATLARGIAALGSPAR